MKKIKFYFAAFSFIMLFNFSFANDASLDECQAGGPGSTSCETSVTVEAGVGPVGGGYTSSASTSCGEGYYSCCNSSPTEGASASCKEA